MSLQEQLRNLAQTGLLKPHTPSREELVWHLESAGRFLTDAWRQENSLESRFNMGNSAGHALLMAAIRLHGYRPSTDKGLRSVLYQLLDSLLPAAAGAKHTLARVHNLRNRAEYDGDPIDITQGLVEDLLACVNDVREEVVLEFGKWEKAGGGSR